MARSDVLVTADWAESNLDAPKTVFVEVDAFTESGTVVAHGEMAYKLVL